MTIASPSKAVRSGSPAPNLGRAFGPSHRKVLSLPQLAQRSPGYDAELAYLLSVVSAWSYADEQVLGAKLRYYGLEGASIRRIAVQNNGLLVATTVDLVQSQDGKAAVLAFRGTDPANLIAWLTDVQLMQRPLAGGHVHAGFYASVEVVWDELHEALEAARRGQRVDGKQAEPLESLYLTGHSLGGAMAVVAASRLFERDYRDWAPEQLIKGVYTFGQPMAGDQAFAQTCDERFGRRLFRHVFHRDVIPRVPPKSRLKYVHAGSEWRSSHLSRGWQRSDQRVQRAQLVSALASVAFNAIEARSFRRDLLPGLSIDDHAAAGYVEVSRRAFDPNSGNLVPPQGLVRMLAVSTSDLVTGTRERLGRAARGFWA